MGREQASIYSEVTVYRNVSCLVLSSDVSCLSMSMCRRRVCMVHGARLFCPDVIECVCRGGEAGDCLGAVYVFVSLMSLFV